MMIYHDDVRVNPHGGHDWIFHKGAFCLFCHPGNDDLCSYPYGGFYRNCGYVFGCCFELGCGYHFDLDRGNDDASSFVHDGDVVDVLGCWSSRE